jgi:hypothetical protein
MSRRLKRLVSIWLLGLLAFAQGSLAFAGCAMDREDLARMLAAPPAHECCDEQMPGSMPTNGCVQLATDDLQAVGALTSMAPAPALGAFLIVQLPSVSESLSAAFKLLPQPPAVPPRIFLHSFLI